MYIIRKNQEYIYQAFCNQFITAILGSRRVGKSFLVQNFIQQNINELWVSLNMDLLSERLVVEKGGLYHMIEERAQQNIGNGKKIWVSIDEAQKCPDLFEQIKVIYDQFKNQNAIKFILTGSGFLSLHRFSAESLAGRIYLFYLREFGLRETLAMQTGKPISLGSTLQLACEQGNWQLLEQYVNKLRPFKPLLEECLNQLFVWGGLPEVSLIKTSQERLTYISNYLQTYLEKDVRAITTITDLTLYQGLMEITAEQTGSLRDERRIILALQCSRDTIKKYRGFLQATLAYQEIHPYIGSSLKRLVKSPKAYLINNGIISYLTGIHDLELLNKTGIIGHRIENWFLNELHVWLDGDSSKSQIYYWRTSGNVEVDFVVVKKPHVFPFEVTYGKRVDSKKLKHLITFLQEQKNAKIGFYVYGGEFNFDAKNNICFLPLWTIG